LERKLEKRQEWSVKAQTAASRAFDMAHKIGDMIPPGQPILVGHHSEKRHRRDLGRIDSNMRKGIERLDMAATHVSKAGNIEAALDSSIFSDDDNAIQALKERIAEHEASRERMKTVNKLYRKSDAAGLAALGLDLETLKTKLAAAGPYWGSAPHLPYEMSNLGGRISTDRKRLEYLRQQKELTDKAEASPNGITLEQCQMGYVRVTFAEKPDRSVLTALRESGFHWGGGSWAGKADVLPQIVKDMLQPAAEVAQ